MRKLFGILAVGALVFAGGTASAAPVNTTGTITVNLGALGSFSVSGTGTVDITGTGSFSGGGVTGSQIAVGGGLAEILGSPLTINIDPNDTTVVSKVVLQPGVGNDAGTFVDSHTPGTRGGVSQTCNSGNACVVGGGAGGVMPIVGDITLHGIPILGTAMVDLANFNIGDGGTFTDTLGGLINISGSAAPWTTQTARVFTVNGATTSSVAGDGNDPITFVTPTFLNVIGNALPIITSFSLSGISVVPEPGTLLLLGSGIAGLALASRRRK